MLTNVSHQILLFTQARDPNQFAVVTGETQIYNLKGELETVKQVLEHEYFGEILHVNVSSSIDPLVITPQHPIYSITGQSKNINYSVIRKRLESNLIKPDGKQVI